DRRGDRLAGEGHADEADVELTGCEELLAPRVEQQPVRRPGDLRALRDEAGQTQRCRSRALAVEVAPPRIPAHEVFGHVQRAPRNGVHGCKPTVAAGVNTTVDDHNGAPPPVSKDTTASTTTYVRPRRS